MHLLSVGILCALRKMPFSLQPDKQLSCETRFYMCKLMQFSIAVCLRAKILYYSIVYLARERLRLHSTQAHQFAEYVFCAASICIYVHSLHSFFNSYSQCMDLDRYQKLKLRVRCTCSIDRQRQRQNVFVLMHYAFVVDSSCEGRQFSLKPCIIIIICVLCFSILFFFFFFISRLFMISLYLIYFVTTCTFCFEINSDFSSLGCIG